MPGPWIGIDPAWPRRPCGFAVLGDNGIERLELIPWEALPAAVAAYPGHPVGIDCPLSMPTALHCFDPACPCPDVVPGTRKAAEHAVVAMGIPLYWTTKRSIIRRLVTQCVGLRERLEAAGHPVFEVYPYAAKVRLFGRPIPKKGSPDGLAWLRQRMAGLVGDAPALEHAGHDELDALLVAHVLQLLDAGRAEEVGDPREGTIVVPFAAGSKKAGAFAPAALREG